MGLLSTDPSGSFDSFDEEESAPNKKERFDLRAAIKTTNAAVLALALGTFFAAELLHLEGVRNMYEAAMSISPMALMGGISGLVYGLGDVTAQAFDTRISFSGLDWQRTLRSAAIGAFAHGPLSYLVFSSDNSLIDQAAQLSALEEWQQVGMKMLIDQTAGSVAWNTLYFALLGSLRRDTFQAVFQDLRDHGFDLLKAGWRIWPIVHMVTYSVIPAQDRLLFVDLVELAWISVLLVWTLQKGSDTEEDDALAFADQTDSGSTTSEMRALLVDSVDDIGDCSDTSKLQGASRTDS